MESDGDRCENGGAVGARPAVERLVDMFEAASHRHAMAGQQCKLRRAAGKPFESGQSVIGGDLADCVHSGMEVER